MKPQLLRMGGGENITVPVNGNDYETCVHAAMARLRAVLPDTRIVRTIEEAEAGDWFFDSSDCQISAGGQQLSGTFTFRCQYDDPEDD